MKKTFKFGWLILAIGAVIAIVGAVFHGVKAVEFDGLKVQAVKKDRDIQKTYAKKEFDRIEIENGSGYFAPVDLDIRQGSDYSVSYSGSSRFEPKISYQNGTLKIIRGRNISGTVSFDFTDYRTKIDSKLVITVPENVKLSTLKVEGIYNNLDLEKLNVGMLELDLNHTKKLELNEVTAERTDVDTGIDAGQIINSKLNNGKLEFTAEADLDLVVSGGELNNIKVKTEGRGRVYYKDGLVLNGGSTQLADIEYGYEYSDDESDSEDVDDTEPSPDLDADTITVKGKYEIKNTNGAIRVGNVTVQGYRLTNKHGKNTLHDQQQTNGGTLEENADQADVLTLDNQTGENTIK